jgi:3-hydroxybutyryl-CoA dehydrogenase
VQQEAATVNGYIILQPTDPGQLKNITLPVILNSVICTLKEMNTAANVLRINGWKGFISRTVWEIAGQVNEEVKQLLAALNKQLIEVPDEPGLIAARPIAMIINEAFFALGEDVSSKAEIDIAMKLGTNYPFGPFEWAAAIGVKNICDLLFILSENDNRYLPAPLLQKEAAI